MKKLIKDSVFKIGKFFSTLMPKKWQYRQWLKRYSVVVEERNADREPINNPGWEQELHKELEKNMADTTFLIDGNGNHVPFSISTGEKLTVDPDDSSISLF